MSLKVCHPPLNINGLQIAKLVDKNTTSKSKMWQKVFKMLLLCL